MGPFIRFMFCRNFGEHLQFNLALYKSLHWMQKQMIEQAYFKEYSCYEFKVFDAGEGEQISVDYSVNFTDGGNSDAEVLPSVLIDKLSSKQMLYLLNWKGQRDHELLYIKELNDEKWKIIKMNHLPDIITISGGCLYMVAGKNLLIRSLYQQFQEFRDVAEGKIIEVNPCIVQYQDRYGQQYQPGISIICFHEMSGYTFKEYTVHKKEAGIGLKTVVNYILFKKYVQFRHFEVIIPNIIALVFLSEDQFCLYNIQIGEIVESTKTKLMFSKLAKDEKPVIRWKEHVKPEEYSKSLIITIGINSNIELFFFYLKYLPQFQQELSQVNLQDVSNGDFINWSNILVVPYLNLALSGSIILDMAITKTGIIYYSKNELNSQIGHCSYIDLNSIFIQSPILTQEAIIWRRYYEDKSFQSFTDGNRFFIPNRYPIQLVFRHLNEQYDRSSEQYDRSKSILLNEWRNSYKFKSIIAFNEEMLIVRAGSLNVFRAVQEELYHFEFFSEEKLSLLQKIERDNSKVNIEVQNLFMRTDSEFEELPFRGEIDRPILKERKYKIIPEIDYDEDQEAEERAKAKFKKLVKEFQKIMTEDIERAYSTMNIRQFTFPLACNQLYDHLNYYHLIVNSKSFRLTSEQFRQHTKDYELQSCIIKLISYFYQFSQRLEEQYNLFGSSLLVLFLKSHLDRLTSDIDTSVYSFLKLMFQNLFPIKKSNYTNSQINPDDGYDEELHSNSFVDFLIKELIKALGEESAGGSATAKFKCKYLREELSNIIKIGLLDYKSIYFSNLWKNPSLFKALLLCNDSQNLSSYFIQFLLKSDNKKFLKIYKKMSQYMVGSDIGIIENQLFLNINLHDTSPNISQIIKAQTGTRQSEFESLHSIITLMKKDIFTEHRLNHDLDEEIKSSKQLLLMMERLIQKESDEYNPDDFAEIKERLGLVEFFEDDTQLQFYENVLQSLIVLFNHRIPIEGWTLQNENTDQDHLLAERKEQLSTILNQIERYFRLFKQKYRKIYEENLEQAKGEKQEQNSQIERENNFQMVLLKERFISDPSRFNFFSDNHNFICCSISINLLRLALNPQNNFGYSLTQTENLICFWVKWLNFQPSKPTYQFTLYFEMIYLFNRDDVEKYLQNDRAAYDNLWNIYNDIKNEANYEFFNLFKFEHLQPNTF